jgi:hypothetical protein
MKLQYLGDVRDAFKWDLLHWIVTKSSPPFEEQIFVPLLNPDVKDSNEGRTPHQWFECRDFIRSFIVSLKDEPRSLALITNLGSADPDQAPFRVSVFHPRTYIGSGKRRTDYWSDFEPKKFSNSVVFFDPDNGFETKTQRGKKWLRYTELKDLFTELPESSVVVVYQHRPRRTWSDLFADLNENLGYVNTVVAAHEGNLAFIAMATTGSTGKRILSAMRSYANEHPVVRCTVLRIDHA